jgi:cytochrome c oxidase subunit 1
MTRSNHNRIALGYTVLSAGMLLLAFGMVLVMRWQLAYPGKPLPFVAGWFDGNHPWLPEGVLLPNFYNQLAGMHGTLMIFLAVVPVLVGGLGSYLVPPMIGARGLAFPRVATAGLLAHVAGIALILAGFFVPNGPPGSGWTAYAPLSNIEPVGQTLWLMGIGAVYVSSMCLCINLIVTIVQRRAPGMSLFRMPFFVWTQLVTSLLLLLAFPPLMAAGVLQLMDRLRGTSFFLPSGLVVNGTALEQAGGGSALLWQHLFWFLAHPEVYVLLLPALGIVGEVIATNTRRPLLGYRWMVAALVGLAVMSMLVWAHHMYLTGMGTAMSTFFQVTTVIISLPSLTIGMGLLLTLWGGRIHFTTPMIFALGFLPMFALGGFTGLPLALGTTNIPLHDTNYVVGHFHYIAAPGILFALFAGIYHWFPRLTGRQLGHRLGHAHFWLSFAGMNGVFMPMLLMGLAGVNRRMYDGGISYAHGQDVHFLQVAATHSAFLLGVAQLFFLVNLVWSLVAGRKVEANPWRASTLEWQPESPGAVVQTGPYAYDEEGDGFTPQATGNDAGHLPPTPTGFRDGTLGTGLLILTFVMTLAALQSSFLLLRTANAEWPQLPYSYSWWGLRAVLLFGMTGLAWHAARHADRAVRLLLIAAALGVAAVYALAMEHGHVAQVSGMKAASHNAYACYYLLTGAEGVSTVAWTLCIAAVALLIWLRKTSAAAARNLGLFGVYLIALWAIHLFLFTAYNGGNG